jgi:hypothetical protein
LKPVSGRYYFKNRVCPIFFSDPEIISEMNLIDTRMYSSTGGTDHCDAAAAKMQHIEIWTEIHKLNGI